MFELTKRTILLMVTALLFGCAATKEGMTVKMDDYSGVNKSIKFDVAVVKGNFRVSESVLKESLSESLNNAGLLGAGNSSLKIDMDLWKLESSFDMGAGALLYSDWTATSNYKVYSEGVVIKNIPVTTRARVTVVEMPIGEIRGLKAREKAVKENIREFIRLINADPAVIPKQ